MTTSYVLVIPVYNEAKRAPKDFYSRLNSLPLSKIIFIDDGSSDNSKDIISSYIAPDLEFMWLSNESNIGKAESIRKAMAHLCTDSKNVIITADADGAIAVEDIGIIIAKHSTIYKGNSLVISAARVRLAGNSVKRTPLRQWIGRIIATVINIISEIDMYDPQSPLKLYDVESDLLKSALEASFKTRWFYEMELILRFGPIEDHAPIHLDLIEFPIEKFTEVPGSNLKKRHIMQVLRELSYIYSIKKSKIHL